MSTMSVILTAWNAGIGIAGSLLKNAGPIVAAIAISKILLESWRRTLGRRRRWVRLYRQLSLGLQLDYAVELFGKAAYKSTVRDGEGNEVTEYVWPLATDGYLQAVVEDDSVIKRYSLTTASKWFRPKFKMGSPGNSATFEVKLGKTTFSSLPGEPTDVYLARGASFYEYVRIGILGGRVSMPTGFAATRRWESVSWWRFRTMCQQTTLPVGSRAIGI